MFIGIRNWFYFYVVEMVLVTDDYNWIGKRKEKQKENHEIKIKSNELVVII